MPLPLPSVPFAMMMLRAIMGIIFISHGAARLYYSSVEGFGAYLDSRGLLIGIVLAWIITVGEIIGGLLLVAGKWVPYCVLFHGAIITAGIFLIHIPNGWFVVGHGSGGVEFSLLIMAVLLLLYTYYGHKRSTNV